MKKLLKLFFRPKALAKSTANGIARAVNESEEAVKSKIMKISATANELAVVAATLTEMTKDGTIDAVETETLAKMLEPYYVKAKELI